MNEEQWRIHQEQQVYMFAVIMAATGVGKDTIDIGKQTFKNMDTWSSK